jgi:sugar/nucleoside kinase (ribokinase family)
MPDLAVIGDINADILMPIDKFPELEKEVSAKDLKVTPGGNACNSALACSKLGIDTGFIGKLGNDLFGNFLKENLEENGVDTRALISGDLLTSGATCALIKASGRAFVSFKGDAARLSINDIDWDYVKDAKGVLFSGSYHVLDLRPDLPDALKKAKELGLITFLDTTYDTKGEWKDLYPAIPYIDYLFVGSEGEVMAGSPDPVEIGKFFQDLGAKLVVVKRGDEGSYIFKKNSMSKLSAFDVEAVDGTGCGDAFVSGFIYGVLSGFELEKSHIFASACGGITATGYGTASQPNLREVKEFLESKGLM